MRPIPFVAMLFCLTLAVFIIGIGNLYEVVGFHMYGKPAIMELADSQKKIIGSVADFGSVPLDVEYVSGKESLVMPQKTLDSHVAQRLLDGEKVPMTYLQGNPQKIYYSSEELPNPWGWLLAGIACAGLSLYALKLLRKESGQ